MAEDSHWRTDAGCREGCPAIQRGSLTLLVIDASALVQACLAAGGVKLFQNDDLVAPPLRWSETASVLHELRWRREISDDLTSKAFARFLDAPVRRRAYVALARILGCRLFTVDDRLRRGAGRVVEVVGPRDF